MKINSTNQKSKYIHAIIAMLTAVIMAFSTFSVYAISSKDKSQYSFYGIDVSVWQGNIDWDAVKRDGADYAFIRAGATKTGSFSFIEDSKFETNMNNAAAAGVARGVYWYSQATTVEEAKSEAEALIEAVSGTNPELPLVMDMEFSNGRFDAAYANWKSEGGIEYASEQLTEIAEAFLSVCRENGYASALYISKYLENSVDTEWLSEQGYELWIAQYNETNTSSSDYTYWQYSSTDRIDGITSRIDSDYMYVSKSPINNDGINASLTSEAVVYTGDPVTPEETVTDGTKILTKDEDYTVIYLNNIEKGTAHVLIKGKGDYEGYAECLSFEIEEEAADNKSDGQPTNVVTSVEDNKTYVKFNAAEGKVDDYQIAYRDSDEDEWQYATTGGRTEFVIDGTPAYIKVSAVGNNEIIGSQIPNDNKTEIVDNTVKSDVGLTSQNSAKKSTVESINQEVRTDVSLGTN